VLVTDGSGYCAAHQSDKSLGKFADSRRGSRHDRGYGTEWEKIRKRILRRDCGLCQPCLHNGRYKPATQVDHIINKAAWKYRNGSLIGVDAEENLQSICTACHETKTAEEAKRGRVGG
jgi:5-methylcytosine-specific restriction protein A